MDLVTPMTGTSIHAGYDTLVLTDNEILFRNFRIQDARGEDLTLEGTVRYHPELDLSVRIISEQFSLLHNRGEDSQIQGDLAVNADLTITGGMDHLLVQGQLNTVPGARIKYISEESFSLVDASQTVTFMELGNVEQEEIVATGPSRMKIDWNVDLLVNQTSVEILLDEIKQQYIQINSQGSLNVRSGVGHKPRVYGSITASRGRAFILPPAIPELDLVIEDATIRWIGMLDEPVISFRGYKLVKGVTSGISQQLKGSSELVDFRIYVILDEVTLTQFDLQFDLEVEDSEAQILLATLPRSTRQEYALNLLVFGRIGTEKIEGNAMLADQVTKKLNELSRRNLKNTGLSFSSYNYRDRSDGVSERERTELSYALSRGFLHDRLNVSAGGSVGFYMDDLTVLPPSNLIGDLELSYRLTENPTLILKGTRKNVFEGIIDGMVTEESVGLTFQKSYHKYPVLFRGTKNQKGKETR
jgi:hypothetical protein